MCLAWPLRPALHGTIWRVDASPTGVFTKPIVSVPRFLHRKCHVVRCHAPGSGTAVKMDVADARFAVASLAHGRYTVKNWDTATTATPASARLIC